MITRNEIVEIGSYNKPHGINGELSATFLCSADVATKFSCYVSCINGIFVPFFAENIRYKNDQTLLIKFEGIESDKDLKILINQDIFVLKDEYNKLSIEMDCDETPVDFFIGFSITDSSCGNIGEIVDIDDSTDNVLFIVEKDDNTIYIPAIEDLINDIDSDKKIISMTLPDGLINL